MRVIFHHIYKGRRFYKAYTTEGENLWDHLKLLSTTYIMQLKCILVVENTNFRAGLPELKPNYVTY